MSELPPASSRKGPGKFELGKHRVWTNDETFLIETPKENGLKFIVIFGIT